MGLIWVSLGSLVAIGSVSCLCDVEWTGVRDMVTAVMPVIATS